MPGVLGSLAEMDPMEWLLSGGPSGLVALLSGIAVFVLALIGLAVPPHAARAP